MASPQRGPGPLERPQLSRASSAASSYREGRRTPIHYQHHEPAPKRLFRKIALLVQPKDRDGSPHVRRRERSGSTASSFRPAASPATFVAEPSPIVADPPDVDDVRPNLKIRIATFNMADNLPAPSGDLSEFLGDLSTFPEAHMRRSRSRRKRSSSGASALFSRGREKAESISSQASAFAAEPILPRFPLSPEHPYHIIVVCGQECPTARSGGVFRGQSWTSLLENYLCGGADTAESSDEEDSGTDHASPDTSLHAAPSRQSMSVDAANASYDEGRSPAAPCTDDERSAAESVEDLPSQRPPSAAGTASISSRTSRRGPYILVEKERLMGIYCAVFVARCCEEFVEGVSKGRVTAGLIGGRVGNKGGVGVSLNFASSRLLFVSAHLAAHASGLDIRKANAQKILDDLEVDDFLETVGPKPKRLVDHFDQVFFMGDLNFRLNISRLHADWLVQARDFANALQFDQLRAVLAEPDGALTGFGEAPINFGPTYKYDLRKVPRKLTRKRSILLHPRHHHKAKSVPPVKPASSALSPYLETSAVPNSSQLDGDAVAESAEDDTASIASTIDVEALDAIVAENSDLLAIPPVADATTADPVRNARVRFLTLVKRNSTLAALETARLRAQASRGRAQNNGQRLALSDLFNDQATTASPGPLPRPILRQSQSTLTPRSAPIGDDSTEPTPNELQDEPAWDSSKKQRVQSWTDRILFYPNRKPDVDSEDKAAEDDDPPALAPAILANDCPAPSALAPTRSRSVRSLPSDRNRRSRSKVRLYRHGSRDNSSDALGSSPANLWHRVKSFPVLTVLDRKLSAESMPASPSAGEPDTSLPEPVQAPPPPGLAPQAAPFRRAPRRHFTLSSDSPQSSPSNSPAHSPAALVVTTDPVDEKAAMLSTAPEKSTPANLSLPRAKTFASALNRLHNRATEAGHGSSSRFRTFLTSLPVALPFLSSPVHETSSDRAGANRHSAHKRLVGPMPGEVMPIKYDSIMNIDRMGAVSDHRPVYLVCAVGIETA